MIRSDRSNHSIRIDVVRCATALLVSCTLPLLPLAAQAGEPTASEAGEVGNAGQVDFVRHVEPLLAQHCYHCHGEAEQEGQLRLDARSLAMSGGVSGKAIEQGRADASLLISRLRSSDEDKRMPPDDEALSPDKIALISRWIDQGAEWPDGVGAQVELAEPHWAYVKPQRPHLPESSSPRWVRNEIDHFVSARLESEGLAPSNEAEPTTLLRRVHLDLIGLPPTVEQIDAFLAAPSEAAYEATIDHLLASPRFGEKWARGWLDLARYSDSNGYQADQLREMWAYRDWVISALNADMPYDQFTIEQIAGDLLPEATTAQKIATGFHRTPTCNIEAGVDPEENRTNQVIDRVNTTGTVWLGTTLDCSRCHNHKYDPFTQKDYYQLFAFFNNTPLEVKNDGGESVQFDFYGPKMTLPLERRQKRIRAEIESQLEQPRAALQVAEEKALLGLSQWESDLLAGEILPTGPLTKQRIAQLKKILIRPAEDRTEYERNRIRELFLTTREATRALREEITELEKQLAATDPDTTLVMVEMPESRMTSIFKRGEFLSPGEAVIAGVPAALHPLPSGAADNRLGLARWLVSPENPLAARVRVNHLWAEMFGRGLVATGEDFGTQGERPSHPDLLDWLAVKFMDDAWSTKRMIKRIVMSATYRQASRTPTDLRERDPENVLLARGPRFRLAAETIRDNGLAIAGLLDLKMGGPPVYPPQPPKIWRQTGRGEPVYRAAENGDRFRRGVYVVWRRVAPYPSFVNFDAPDRTRCVVARSQTNTPMQALTLLNDQAYVEMARSLAARVLQEDSVVDDTDRIRLAFRMCVARTPNKAEVKVLKELLKEERSRLSGSSEETAALTRDARLPADVEVPADSQEWAAWLCVANALLNLDETISKE